MAMTGGTDKIVKSVKPYSDWPSAIELHVYYNVKSQSVANNTTTLLLGMYVKTPDKYPIGAWSEYYGSYIGTATSGTNCKSFNGAIPNFYGTRWLTENQEVTVAHNADGTKTATIYWKWGVSSDSAYGYSNNSGSFDVPLTTIPRASSVSVSGAVNAGSSLTINVARASSAFTHTLRYVIGNASNTIATGVGTRYAWTVPYDLLKQFRTATSGVGTIYCDTYSGTTKLGTTSCGFTVKAPDNDTTKPSASMMLSPSGDVPKVFSGLYIQGKTAVKADFTATSEYSDIKSYALTVNGKTTAGDPSTSETLATNGEVPVVGTVTDTRGYSRTLTENIPVHAYSAPSVAVGAGQTAIVCERAKSNGISDPAGEYLRIVAKRKYSTVDGKNQCVLRFRYKTSTATSYGSWTTLIAESDATDEYNGIVSNVTFPATTSFDVQIGVADTMESETVSTFHIPTDEISFHIRYGGKGAAFFGYSEKDDELSLSGRKITNVGTPTEDEDAVNKISLLDLVYPVGSIYLAYNHTSPASLFGGTWTRIENQFLWAVSDGGSIGITGGSSTHTLTESEMPSHRHNLVGDGTKITQNDSLLFVSGTAYPARGGIGVGANYSSNGYVSIGDTGGGAAHNNMPPYIQVSVWRRTA